MKYEIKIIVTVWVNKTFLFYNINHFIPDRVILHSFTCLIKVDGIEIVSVILYIYIYI